MSTRETIGGCGFALAVTAFSCVLLVMNGGVVAAIYFSVADLGPEVMQDWRAAQAALFVFPVLMLIMQWWLIDVAGSWNARRLMLKSRRAARKKQR